MVFVFSRDSIFRERVPTTAAQVYYLRCLMLPTDTIHPFVCSSRGLPATSIEMWTDSRADDKQLHTGYMKISHSYYNGHCWRLPIIIRLHIWSLSFALRWSSLPDGDRQDKQIFWPQYLFSPFDRETRSSDWVDQYYPVIIMIGWYYHNRRNSIKNSTSCWSHFIPFPFQFSHQTGFSATAEGNKRFVCLISQYKHIANHQQRSLCTTELMAKYQCSTFIQLA